MSGITCRWCLSVDPKLQARTSLSTNEWQISLTNDAAKPHFRKLANIDQITHLRIEQVCIRDRFVFALLGENRIFKYEVGPFSGDVNQTVAFHVKDR
jgi:hypothetical protein